jgi:hypothetical protein
MNGVLSWLFGGGGCGGLFGATMSDGHDDGEILRAPIRAVQTLKIVCRYQPQTS